MIVELISTGSELLLGDTINTNVSWLAHELNAMGYTIAFQSTIGDNRGRMGDCFIRAAERADLIICTGGLGPTQGDITREVLASVTDRSMTLNQDAMAEVQSFFERVGRPMPEASEREATLPKGAGVLHNPVGVAPGVTLAHDGVTYVLLPGPPGEMKAMFTESVAPYLVEKFGSQGVVKSHRFAIYGMREIDLESNLMDLVKAQSNPTIAFLIKKGYIELRITAKADTLEEAKALLAPWDSIIKGRLGDKVGRNLDISLEDRLGYMLINRKESLASAESCTAGLIGKLITDRPGSSAYYRGGIISYTNEVKHNVLGVPQEILDTVGAVSPETAKAMAEGAKRLTGATYGVSTTGIAGPGGAEPGKPVGLVWIAVAGPKGTVTHKTNYIGNRDAVRQSAAEMALYYVKEYMEGCLGSIEGQC